MQGKCDFAQILHTFYDTEEALSVDTCHALKDVKKTGDAVPITAGLVKNVAGKSATLRKHVNYMYNKRLIPGAVGNKEVTAHLNRSHDDETAGKAYARVDNYQSRFNVEFFIA